MNGVFLFLNVYRYDGLYKVVKYYKADNKGFVTWKFLLRRDDIEPAPWTKEGKKFMEVMSVGHMEVSVPPARLHTLKLTNWK